MNRHQRYPREVRERAVRLVLKHRDTHRSEWAALTSIASKIGCSAESLRHWVRRAEIDQGKRAGLTSAERDRLRELERENRELVNRKLKCPLFRILKCPLAETIIGLYKTEVIRARRPWKGLDEVEYATLEWVDWFNHRRLLAPLGNVSLAEFERIYYGEDNRLCLAA